MAESPENNTDGPLGISVKVNGEELPDDTQIMSVRTLNEVNRIPEARFVVMSDRTQVEDFAELDSGKPALGDKVEISAFYGDDASQVLFKGIILAARARLDMRDGVQMEFICRDPAIALTEVRRSVSYVQASDSDIMGQIIGDAGLTADVTATSDNPPINLRVDSTDWDFLRLLADRNGYVLTIDDSKITAGRPDTGKTETLGVTYGVDVLDIDITTDAHRMVATTQVDAWNEQTQAVVTGSARTPPELTLGAGATTVKDAAKVLKDRAARATTARDLEQAELNTYAKARLDRASLAVVQGMVKFQGCGLIHPADMLAIADLGQRFTGKGFVCGVEHRLEDGFWTTTARLGLPQDWTSDVHGMAGPAATALTTPVHGMQIGVVLAVAGDADGKQRIQVSLPMIGDPPAEVWTRHATPYASSGAGIQFLPEVGDEVVIAFLNADPNAPVIVGSLHNQKALRPETEEEDNNIKTIVTRSALTVKFDDDQKIITVETPGGHKLTMDDAASSFSMNDMNGNSIVMDASGITLTSDGDVTVTAGGNVTVGATADASVTGNNVTCEAAVGFTGTGSATAELSSGGQVKVEGAMVMIN